MPEYAVGEWGGWHVAHIFGAKDGNTASDSWSREELRRRFLRNFHPCNIFYIPKTNWQVNGADPRVIAYFAARLAERFGRVWTDFVAVAGRPLEGRASGSFEFSCAETTASSPVGVDRGTGAPAVTYTYRNRLCFKAKHIEPLAPEQAFRVVAAGIGVYQMTKAQFYEAFPNIEPHGFASQMSEGRGSSIALGPRKNIAMMFFTGGNMRCVNIAELKNSLS